MTVKQRNKERLAHLYDDLDKLLQAAAHAGRMDARGYMERAEQAEDQVDKLRGAFERQLRDLVGVVR